MVGFDHDRLQKNNVQRQSAWFKAFYGVEPTTAVPYLAALRAEYPDIVYKDCLMTMNWLTLYDAYPILTARWKSCEEYIGPKVIKYGMKMAKLAEKIITFRRKHSLEISKSVDCATFMVQEMRLDPSSEWFDWKTHSCGLVSLFYIFM